MISTSLAYAYFNHLSGIEGQDRPDVWVKDSLSKSFTRTTHQNHCDSIEPRPRMYSPELMPVQAYLRLEAEDMITRVIVNVILRCSQ